MIRILLAIFVVAVFLIGGYFALMRKEITKPAGAPEVVSDITILSPNGDEMWQIGTTQTIKWSLNTGKVPQDYTVILSLESLDGITSGLVAVPYAVSRTFDWKIDIVFQGDVAFSVQPGNYKLRISLLDGAPCMGMCPSDAPQPRVIAEDSSDAPFKIVAAEK